MATKFRVYDGEQIVFYSTDLTKSATLFLNTSDQLEIGGTVAGSGDSGNGGFKTPSIELLTSITGAGTWSAAIIAANKGGTGFGAYVVGDILYADTTSTLAKLAGGTGNEGASLVINASGLPVYSNSLGKVGQTTTMAGNLAVTGTLTVSGTTTTINTTTLLVSDNIITLNQDVTGTPTENSGIEIERGTSTNAMLQWNETTDAWEIDKAGTAGTLEQIVTLTSSQLLTNKTYSSSATATGLTLTPLATGFSVAGGTTSKTATHTATQTFTGTDNTQLSLAGNFTTSGAYALTLTQTGATNVTLPTSGTLYGTASSSITSAQLLASLSDETGTGVAVFATSPTLVTPILGVATGTSLALGGATIGTNALAVTGTSLFTGDVAIATTKAISNTYTSGVLGVGYKLSHNVDISSESYLEIDNILVRNTLRTHIFQKDVVKVTNGYLYVSDSIVITAFTGTTGAGTVTAVDEKSAIFTSFPVSIWFKDWNPTTGTITSVKFTVDSLASATGGVHVYNVTATNGTTLADLVIGGAAVRTSGGAILMDASSANSPFMDVLSGGSTYVRTGYLLGMGLAGYGIWGSTDGTNGSFYISSNGVAKIAGWSFTTTTLSSTGIALESNATAASANIRLGSATAFATGSGIWMDGSGQFRAGTIAASVLTGGYSWDLTTFKVRANSLDIITATAAAATVAGWSANAASLWSGNADIANAAVSAVLTQNTTKANAKIAVGGGAASANTITVGGTVVGTILTGDGQFQAYATASNYISMSTTALTIKATTFDLVAGTTLGVNNTRIALGATMPTGVSTGTGIYMDSSGIYGMASSVQKFALSATTGTITATGADVSGTINASAGNFTSTVTVGNGATTGSIVVGTHASDKITLYATNTGATTYIGIGSGGYGNASQSFWADGSGRMSLKDKFLWTGAALTVNGTIQATAGYFGNSNNVIDSTGLTISDAGPVARVYVTNNTSWRPPTVGAEKVSNTSFETGITGWTGGAQSSAGDGNGSTYCLQITTDATTSNTEITTPTADTYYELSFDARQKNYYGSVTVKFYKSVNDTDYTGATVTSQLIYLSSAYTSYKIPYLNQTNTYKIKIEFLTTNASVTYPFQVDNVSFKEHTYFTELNSKGLYVYVTPSNYIKLGRDVIDIKTSTMTVNSLTISSDLTVNGSLTVNGNQTIIGSTTVAAPIQILNSGALLSSGYSGIEIDNAVAVTGTGPVFLYDVSASRWKFGVRASGNNGAQTAFTFDTGNLGTVITDISTDTLTNKRLTSPKLNEDVAVTTTATKLNYITSATGTTGTASTNIVFSTSPTLVTPNLGTPSTLVVTNASGTASININGTVGATTANTGVFTTATVNTGLVPDANDGAYLGTTALGFSDLFLATGGVINWANGEVTLTGGGNLLTLAGGDLALGANNLTLTGSIAATGSRVTKGWFTDLESTNALTIGGVKISDTIRIEEALSTGGLAQDTAHQVPGGVAYNAWVGSGAGTTFQTSRTMQVFIDGRLQRPGATYDYVECNNLGTAVAQYASTTYIKFTYDLAEGTNITYIITAV